MKISDRDQEQYFKVNIEYKARKYRRVLHWIYIEEKLGFNLYYSTEL